MEPWYHLHARILNSSVCRLSLASPVHFTMQYMHCHGVVQHNTSTTWLPHRQYCCIEPCLAELQVANSNSAEPDSLLGSPPRTGQVAAPDTTVHHQGNISCKIKTNLRRDALAGILCGSFAWLPGRCSTAASLQQSSKELWQAHPRLEDQLQMKMMMRMMLMMMQAR